MSVSEGSEQTGPVECPRCGYDQRGMMATWTDSCPLHTTCSECGLQIEWREVLNPLLSSPKWCVETRPPRLVTPRQIIATFLRTFWPWSFWSRLRMTHPIRPRRILLYLVVLLAVANGAIAMRSWSESIKNVSKSVLPLSGPGNTVVKSPLQIGLHAALLPFSGRSIGAAVVTWRIMRSDSPLDLQYDYWLDLHRPMALALLGQIVCGLAFAALPISRRRAKVRWRHIVRVTAYGLALLAPIAFLGILDMGLNSPYWGWTSPMGELATLMLRIASVMLLPMAFLWWLIAVRRYLKMEHAWAVSISVLSIGVLTPLALLAALYLLSWIRHPF